MKFNILLLGIFVFLMLTIPMRNVLPKKSESTVDKVAIMSPDRFNSTETSPNPPKEKPFFSNIPSASKNININTNFKILDTATGKIKSISQRDYVLGAVCAEMPPNFHSEALKCQAVAAHTYALYNVAHKNPELDGADFSADPANWHGYVTKEQAKERFGDKFDIYWGKIEASVDDIYGNVMIYNKEPILAAYHSMSAGKTETAANVWSGESPVYLVPVDSSGDIMARDYETKKSYKINTVKNIILNSYPQTVLEDDYNTWLEVTSTSDSGYVTTLQMGDTKISGNQARKIFGLRSACFDIENNGQEFTFTVRGYGHGVGLSQYGADYMARQGYECKDIMEHYYKNASMVKVK